MSKVAIWMGHSGSQVGATGIVVEDNVTRQAREWSVAYARACGHTVTTDNDNMSLVQRINASDSTHAGILEWHANSGGGTGTEIRYSQYDNGKGRKIAESMLSVTANYGFKSRGAKNSESNRYGRLGILDDTKPLALLVETMFVDTQDDVNDWTKNGKAMVEAMTAKFLAGLGLKSAPSSTPAPSKPVSKPTPKQALKSMAQIVAEVKNGDWGNNPTRASRLTKAGYNAQAIQDVVNGKKTVPRPTPKPAPVNGWIAENGKFRLNRPLPLLTSANLSGSEIAMLQVGDVVKYNAFAHIGGYVWIRQPRSNGYGYLATGVSKNGKRQNYWGSFS